MDRMMDYLNSKAWPYEEARKIIAARQEIADKMEKYMLPTTRSPKPTHQQKLIAAIRKKRLHAARQELVKRLPDDPAYEIMSGDYDRGPAMARVLADMEELRTSA